MSELMVHHGMVTHKMSDPCLVCDQTTEAYRMAVARGEVADLIGITPSRYKATAFLSERDRFTGKKSRQVEGYYVRHLTATPAPISTQYERDKFLAEHTKHYIMADGFSDWNMPKELDIYEIDVMTLEKIDG